jgi:hypothetical protein
MSKKPKKIKGKTLQDYIDWLEETLIPDLKDSGMVCTAEDFETCIEWMEFLREENKDA